MDTFRDDLSDIYHVHNINNYIASGKSQVVGIINYEEDKAKTPLEQPT